GGRSDRDAGPATALRVAGEPTRRWGRRGPAARRGLPAGAGGRHAAGGRPRPRHRPPGDAAGRRAEHPRRGAVPALEARVVSNLSEQRLAKLTTTNSGG